jgi:hypothetical protein
VLVQQRDRRDRSLMAFEGAQHLAGVEIPQLRTSLYQEITDKIIADRNPLWRKKESPRSGPGGGKIAVRERSNNAWICVWARRTSGAVGTPPVFV